MSLAKLTSSDDDFMKLEGGAAGEEKMDAERIKKLVKENLYSGITVSLVSAVLSPALAMAQGATAMMGLSTGIYGAGIAGVIGGSHYNILGPAGALVNIVSNLANENGKDIIPWVAFVAGAMSLVVYLVKFENYCTMLPSSVLEGFSFGVATTIGLGQLGFALGLPKNKEKEFYMKVAENFGNIGVTQMKEFLCFLPLFVILMTLSKWKPAVPWIIVIAALGITYGVVMKQAVADPLYTPVLLKDIYPSLAGEVNLGYFGYWSPEKEIPTMNIIVGALKVAFVAVLETLISARIADNKTNTRFDQSQEIFGMSIANMVCGLMGGTPCTGVLIRTNVNIQTGATHKMSQFLNAVFVFLIVVLFMPIFTYIPMACIAAILMTSACRLVPKTIIAELWKVDRFEFWILIITWLICVFKDGAVGLLIGAFLSFLKQSEKTSETQLQLETDGKFLNVELDGSLDYINGLHFETKVFDKINEDKPEFTIVNLSRALFVDIDGLMVLK
jgi:SulP family sulfate permease